MVRFIDTEEREKDILNLIVDSYIVESKPISSSYLCEKYNLGCSSATVRNVMLALEKKGLLSHIHTSSGRVPTKQGFKVYVGKIKEEDILQDYPMEISFYPHEDSSIEEVMNYTMNALAQISGYTSLVAIAGKDEKLFFSGTRFILEQPEFEDMKILKNLFYALEVKMIQLQETLFSCFDERIRILIGDDIGFEDISECALVGARFEDMKLSCVLALLGPVRMDYLKAVTSLSYVKNQLKEAIGELL